MSGASVAIRGLRKSYGSTVALAEIDMDLHPGEILGIAGPNGAGKSTLVRILAGEESADAGTLTMDGAAWSPLEDWTATAVVHQEPELFPNLTVAENMLVGREGTAVARPSLGSADHALMTALAIGNLSHRLLEDCTLAVRQRTEIARALAREARLFLFDEPNSALTDDESSELFHEMHKIAASGRIVILITHRLADLVSNCSRVAVIRDGRVRTILEGAALTEEGIAQQLVLGSGRGPEVSVEQTRGAAAELLSVRRWSHARLFKELDFSLSCGEIVALMGVEGSGARALLRSLAGLEDCQGEIAIGEFTGKAAILRCSAYVPAMRQVSLYSNFSVGENLVARLGRPAIAGPMMALKRQRMREIAREAASHFLVKTRTLAQGIRSLSGGNQQKVAIAQAMVGRPRLVLLEEPTRGVDVQSKREIYRLLRNFARAGNAAVIFCTEVLEVFEAADRVVVVSDGRLAPALEVRAYADVEALATAVSRLERHASQVPAG